MTRTKKHLKEHWTMPKSLWQLPNTQLNWRLKHFLNFIWWCAPRGCVSWNCLLQKRFKVSRSTIKNWIRHLKKHELIAIGYPDGPGRTIWPRYRHKPNFEAPEKPIKEPSESQKQAWRKEFDQTCEQTP